MAFYETQNLSNFLISKTSLSSTLKIVYASFSFDGSEFKIIPVNLNSYGYFLVSSPGGSSIEIQFISDNSTVLCGTILDYNIFITQPTQNTIVFTISNLTPGQPYSGSMTLILQ